MPIRQRIIPTPPKDTTLPQWDYTVKGRSFEAGFNVKDGRVSAASPIIHNMIGKRLDTARNECASLCYEITKRGE
jgi:hypothetical protein